MAVVSGCLCFFGVFLAALDFRGSWVPGVHGFESSGFLFSGFLFCSGFFLLRVFEFRGFYVDHNRRRGGGGYIFFLRKNGKPICKVLEVGYISIVLREDCALSWPWVRPGHSHLWDSV